MVYCICVRVAISVHWLAVIYFGTDTPFTYLAALVPRATHHLHRNLEVIS